jgi:thymidylate synthase (FAD)
MVSLVSITEPGDDLKSLGIKTAEDLIVYIARVSNPNNQTNMDTAPRLLKYLIKHKHWSPFEHVSATLRITTSRAIAAQILRHRSFTFQEFSQRYSEAVNTEPVEFRAQGKTNRQVGEDPIVIPQHLMEDFNQLQWESKRLYKMLIEEGVAKECARMVLPLNTSTTIYMTGTLRSWIHYIQLRNTPETQKEHRDIAFKALTILNKEFPTTFSILDELFKYDQ